MFTVSIHHAAIACDAALRHRFLQAQPAPLVLVPPKRSSRASAKTFDRPAESVRDIFDALAARWRLPNDKAFGGSFGELFAWAKKSGVIAPKHRAKWESTRHFRNALAHGSAMIGPPTWAFGFLSTTAWMLNPLFPDPDTDAYDEARQAPAKRAAEEMERFAGEVDELGDEPPEPETE